MTKTHNPKLSSRTKGAASARLQKKTPRKKPRQKKRPAPSSGPPVPMGEALRAVGMDERTVAKKYVSALNKLETSHENGAVKLLVDVLKECCRLLEPPRPAGASGPPDAPMTVNLILFASRPSRLLNNS